MMPANMSRSSWQPKSNLTSSVSPWNTPPRQARAAPVDPHGEDHAVDVDARRRGESGVVGDGADGLAEPGRLEQRAHEDEHGGAHHDRHDGRAAEGDARDRVGLRAADGVLRIGPRVRSEPDLEEVLQQERQADRDDHHRDEADAASPQRPPQEPVEAATERAADRHGDERGEDQVDAVVVQRNHATIAPNVTISPWAKLTSPVVPKMSERPDRAHRDDEAELDPVRPWSA